MYMCVSVITQNYYWILSDRHTCSSSIFYTFISLLLSNALFYFMITANSSKMTTCLLNHIVLLEIFIIYLILCTEGFANTTNSHHVQICCTEKFEYSSTLPVSTECFVPVKAMAEDSDSTAF